MTADTLLINAKVHTMDLAHPRTDAVLIRGGSIAALGAAAHRMASPGARLVDCGGRLVLPGFQDAHIHLLNGGTDLVETAQLYDATTLGEVQAALAGHASRWTGEMVWGAGWQCGFFGDANLTREVIDAVVRDRPCLIYDGNFHNACLNSRAVEMVGITDDTPDPLNGHIVRDANGRATGMLHEEAINWACEFLPQTSDETLRLGLKAGMDHANRHGITGIIDASVVDRQVRHYGAAEREGGLTMRVAGAMLVTAADTVETALTRLTALRSAHSGRDFHLNAAKFFLDGGLENGTAAMIEPYIGGGNAPLMLAPDQIAALFTALDAARFQIHVHCIGDMATRAALDGFQAARTANGVWPSLHQIAHVEVVHPDDQKRFAALGVMANMQPLWAANDPIIPEPTWDMVGPARMAQVYPFRSLIDAGAPWCLNSDWAVTTLNPFEIIGTAVTREPPRKRGRAEVFTPAERITVEEAVMGYTTGAAAACWRGHYTGRIAVGCSGDVIVLDRDILTCDPHDIAETQVLLTLFQGRDVYHHPSFA